MGRPPQELLAQRLALVARASEANAQALRLRQELGGIEVELARGDEGELEPLERRDVAARAAMAECERVRAALEVEIAALDRELAAG